MEFVSISRELEITTIFFSKVGKNVCKQKDLDYICRALTRRLMALDAIALKFALANERDLLLDCSSVPLKASMNSSLCNLRANAASSSWLGIPLLLAPTSLLNTLEGRRLLLTTLWSSTSSSWLDIALLLLALKSLLDDTDARALRLLKLLDSFSLLWCSASRLFNAPAAFLASTSCGNRSCIVFQSTVFTVQDLPLLQSKTIKFEPQYQNLKNITGFNWKYLISCLHFGHLFPHLSAADLKHFLQKL